MPGKTSKRHRLFAGLAILIVVLLIVGGFALSGLADFDLEGRNTRLVEFDDHGNRLSGTLILPDGAAAATAPIVLLIHGDGPQDRFSHDGYLPLINSLLDGGIGVYSWDKAGVGNSTGNWLDQSMNDRANEAMAAFAALRNLDGNQNRKIGFLGFSQAGWVIPDIANRLPDAAFHILVGAAVNWQRQGTYYMRTRLEALGTRPDEIAMRIETAHNMDNRIFGPNSTYQDYLAIPHDQEVMAEDRYEFVKRNIGSDATGPLETLTSPLLALWGEDDLNVDPAHNAAIYRKLALPNNPLNRVITLPDATHGLLRAGLFNYQLADQMPDIVKLAFVVMGRHAYAPGAMDHITTWIRQVTEAPSPAQ